MLLFQCNLLWTIPKKLCTNVVQESVAWKGFTQRISEEICRILWGNTFDGVYFIGKLANLHLTTFLSEETLPSSCEFCDIFLNICFLKDLPLVQHLVRSSVLISLKLTSKQKVIDLVLVLLALLPNLRSLKIILNVYQNKRIYLTKGKSDFLVW